MSDNLFLIDPEVGMLEVDFEQLGVHVLELLDHDVLGKRVATFESFDIDLLERHAIPYLLVELLVEPDLFELDLDR